MIVYKFGGASVKDADGVRNLAQISNSCKESLVVVISAFGKTTNAIEELISNDIDSDILDYRFKKIKEYHLQFVNDLIVDKYHKVFDKVNDLFNSLYDIIVDNSISDFNYKYDQTVSFGEILATTIVSEYLNFISISNTLVDIRNCIITDNTYREANVNWDVTRKRVKSEFCKKNSICITQGFIAGTIKGETLTLGREGSDYTASILGNILNVKEVVVWKDVPGVLNADPRYFSKSQKLNKISYQEAVELAYFGAKIIHPKTIKPLQNKGIPLIVKSFIEPENPGTLIYDISKYNEELPIFILKKNQILISFSPKDMSFVIEQSLSRIMNLLIENRIKINLVQSSAVSFSFCIDNSKHNIFSIVENLKNDFQILYNDNLELLTIRHYYKSNID
ncbi:MAG: aspartate kinase, partial [Bacteroidota bacterium]|nr:aspartate kinase [Bacteroidota bacterium]